MIRPEDLLLDQTAPLGGTRTGSVFKATWNQTGLVAVKIFGPETPHTALRDYFDRLAKLKHPNVLDIYGYSPEDADPLFLVTSFQPDGNVRQFLRRYPNADRPKIVLDTALGMLFLHSRGFICGNLSPNNILIREDGRACVADCSIVELQPSSNKDAHRYFSPEAWKGTISRPSDVFAFAMCALEIFTSSPPWGVLSENRIFQLVVQENSRPDCPPRDLRIRVGFTDHFWSILEECWHSDPKLRPSFDHIVRLWHASEIRLQRAASRRKALPVPPSPPAPTNARSRSSSLPERRQGNLRFIATHPRAYDPNAHPVPRRPQTDEPGSAASTTFELTSNLSSTASSPDDSPLPMTPPSAKSRTGDMHPYHNANSSVWESCTSFDVPTARKLPGQEVIPILPPPRSYSIKSRGAARSLPDPDRTYAQSVDARSVQSDDRTSTLTGTSCVLVIGALQSEVKNGRHPEIIDMYLMRVQYLALQSTKFAQKLVTAGIVPMVIDLLKSRAGSGVGLDLALTTLGVLTHDNLTSNTILRTGTVSILIEIFTSSLSEHVSSLALWCLTRLCRSAEAASSLMKTNLPQILLQPGLSSSTLVARSAVWCLGNLIWTDSMADALAELSAIPAIVNYLSHVSSAKDSTSEDICAGLFAVARISRSIKLAKSLAKIGVVPIVAKLLSTSDDAHIVNWAARAVGCMMRPNSSDIAKILLDAGVADGLARLPSILSSEEVEPLGSLAFSVQRFSAAEWSGKTRQRLVDAGVVDALLAALRTAADEPYPHVHVDLALAVSSLADVGGSAVRKEIISAGGVKILKKVGSGGPPEVAKTCNLAITSITGNLLTRNAASAKTALAHTWSGGCSEFQPPCPVDLVEQESPEQPGSASFLALE